MFLLLLIVASIAAPQAKACTLFDDSFCGVKTNQAKACVLTKNVFSIELKREKYPETTLHLQDAWARGYARIVHLDRDHTDQNRRAWQKLVPKSLDTDNDGKVEDRDEWPPAASKEGGNRSKEGLSMSSIAFVDGPDNRGAGAVMGGRLRPYCNGQPFRLVPTGKRINRTTIIIAAENGKKAWRRVSAPKSN
jgi:hypothetical protein